MWNAQHVISIWIILTKLNCSERKQSLFLIETAVYLQITFDSAALSLWSLFFFLIRSFSLTIHGLAAASKLDWVKTPLHMSGMISIQSWYCTMCWKYHMLFICLLIKCCLVVSDVFVNAVLLTFANGREQFICNELVCAWLGLASGDLLVCSHLSIRF